MRIAIVDDLAREAETLRRSIMTYIQASHAPAPDIVLFESGEALLADCREDGAVYDLVFMDIFMEGMTGISAAESLRHDFGSNLQLVFVSSSNDFAAESYRLRADYYLKKPYTDEDIRHMFSCLDLAEFRKNRYVTLPKTGRVMLSQIIYTEYHQHVITLFLEDGSTRKERMGQADLENLLCTDEDFCICNRGIIVNLTKAERLEGGMLIMQSGDCIPVSRRRENAVREQLADSLFRNARLRLLLTVGRESRGASPKGPMTHTAGSCTKE